MLVQELAVGPDVQAQLIRYEDLVPMNNGAFNVHYDRVYPGRPAGGHPDCETGWYNPIVCGMWGTKATDGRHDARLRDYSTRIIPVLPPP